MKQDIRELTGKDVEILTEVNRYRFLTADQLNRLMWPKNTKDKDRYAQKRLGWLVPDEYLIPMELPRPRQGRRPTVFALGWRGRKALRARGEIVDEYFRPTETRGTAQNLRFMLHTLEIIDVLIAAKRFAQDVPGISLADEDVVMERELKRWGQQVFVPGTPRPVAVIPDALFTLTVGEAVQHFVLEVDRDTEHRRVWRDKVAALTYWLLDPETKTLFPTQLITVMVVTTPEHLDDLRAWTEEELRFRGLYDEQASMFAFTAASPAMMTPREFFCGLHWHPPYLGATDSLVDLPAVQLA